MHENPTKRTPLVRRRASRLHVLPCVALVLAASVWSPRANAQDAAAAQQLFDEGRGLVVAGKTAEACPKFEESFRLDPRSGTKFNLADCYEVTGRTATAWTLFLEVASESKAAGREERETVARERATALAPKLSRLSVRVADPNRVPGLVITRNGTPVGEPQWGSAVPVDPGTHVIQASADGYRPWTTRVAVDAGASSIAVDVPKLEPAGVEPAPAPEVPTSVATPEDSSASHALPPQRIAALGVGGLGVVALGVGAFFGISAMSDASDAKSAGCHGNVCPDSSSARRYDDARSAGNVATILFAAGAGVVAAGAVLYFTAPSHSAAEQARSKFVVGVAGNFAFARGQW